MKRESWFLVVTLALAGCGGGVVTTFGDVVGEKSWRLVANRDKGLVDVVKPELGAYPNPRGVVSMLITLRDDGAICADDGKKTWCGGPLQGIPYRSVANVQADSWCVRVVDLYGREVRSGCQQGPAPEQVLTRPASLQQQQPDSLPSLSDASQGARLVIEAVNAGLAKIGLKARVTLPDAKQLVDFKQGDIDLSDGTCKDVLAYLKDEFSDDGPGTDDYVFGADAIKECLRNGSCRVGQLVTRAMATACSELLKQPTLDQRAAQSGVVGAGGSCVNQLCNGGQDGGIDKCVGSPLVLDLAGNGLQLQGLAGGVTFPLLGASALQVGWLAGSDDALLAIDLDGDGKITSGRELFGEATGRHGFAALARYDADGDGVISAADPVFERLLAWRDDGDGVSQPHELIPLRKLGIQSISLAHAPSKEQDAHGNQLGLVGSARGPRGTTIPVIDVWFRMQTARP